MRTTSVGSLRRLRYGPMSDPRARNGKLCILLLCQQTKSICRLTISLIHEPSFKECHWSLVDENFVSDVRRSSKSWRHPVRQLLLAPACDLSPLFKQRRRTFDGQGQIRGHMN